MSRYMCLWDTYWWHYIFVGHAVQLVSLITKVPCSTLDDLCLIHGLCHKLTTQKTTGHIWRYCVRRIVSVAVVSNRTGWRANTNAAFLAGNIHLHFSKHLNVTVNGISSLFKMLRELNFCENIGSYGEIDENSPTGIRLHLHEQRIFDIVIYTLIFDEYSNLMQIESIFYLLAAVTMAEWFSTWNYVFDYKWHRAIIYVRYCWGYYGWNFLHFVRYEVFTVMLMRISLVWDSRFHYRTDLLSEHYVGDPVNVSPPPSLCCDVCCRDPWFCFGVVLCWVGSCVGCLVRPWIKTWVVMVEPSLNVTNWWGKKRNRNK
jgi:hypothetical protein